ncbi:hypothetical protein FRB97_003544 [Tulasnella sp. 331]|nr:hypothetical protein FRB97_003544 [Tulasnella sp. 331]
MVQTAIRSLLMHMSIFLFFAGLIVLVCHVTPRGVWLPSVLLLFLFAIYYIFATVRAPFMAFFRGVNGFDEQDHRGLRVQIWSPFTLSTHHLFNYCRIYISLPTQRFFRSMAKAEQKSRGDRESGSKAVVDHYMARNEGQSLKMDTSGKTSQGNDGAVSTRASPSRLSVVSNVIDLNTEKEGASVQDFQYEDASHVDREFKDRLRATRLRRLMEYEVMRPGQRARQVSKESDNSGNAMPEVHFDGD